MPLDLRGPNRLLPALRTRKMPRRLAHRDRLIVECTDPLVVVDIPCLPHETDDMVECEDAANGLFFIFHIKRRKAWEQHFFARGPPMGRDPGAVSLLQLYHREATPGCRQGGGRPKFHNAGVRSSEIAASHQRHLHRRDYLLSPFHPASRPRGLHRNIDAFDPVVAFVRWMFRWRGKQAADP